MKNSQLNISILTLLKWEMLSINYKISIYYLRKNKKINCNQKLTGSCQIMLMTDSPQVLICNIIGQENMCGSITLQLEKFVFHFLEY